MSADAVSATTSTRESACRRRWQNNSPSEGRRSITSSSPTRSRRRGTRNRPRPHFPAPGRAIGISIDRGGGGFVDHDERVDRGHADTGLGRVVRASVLGQLACALQMKPSRISYLSLVRSVVDHGVPGHIGNCRRRSGERQPTRAEPRSHPSSWQASRQGCPWCCVVRETMTAIPPWAGRRNRTTAGVGSGPGNGHLRDLRVNTETHRS